MGPYPNRDQLVIFDADGTTIDAFHAIEQSFLRHGMAIGDLERFQRRRKLFKYLGGLREFPNNLRQQFGKQNRKRLLETLTDFYRDEAVLYPGIAALLQTLIATPHVRIGMVTRNVTIDPEQTLRRLFARHAIDIDAFDHFASGTGCAKRMASRRISSMPHQPSSGRNCCTRSHWKTFSLRSGWRWKPTPIRPPATQ